MVSGMTLTQRRAHNNRHQKSALWALDSQQVARVCGGRYVAKV